jgi:hypothetical protein
VEGPGPWRIRVPLAAGQRNQVTLVYAHAGPALAPQYFRVLGLRIEDAP